MPNAEVRAIITETWFKEGLKYQIYVNCTTNEDGVCSLGVKEVYESKISSTFASLDPIITLKASKLEEPEQYEYYSCFDDKGLELPYTVDEIVLPMGLVESVHASGGYIHSYPSPMDTTFGAEPNFEILDENNSTIFYYNISILKDEQYELICDKCKGKCRLPCSKNKYKVEAEGYKPKEIELEFTNPLPNVTITLDPVSTIDLAATKEGNFEYEVEVFDAHGSSVKYGTVINPNNENITCKLIDGRCRIKSNEPVEYLGFGYQGCYNVIKEYDGNRLYVDNSIKYFNGWAKECYSATYVEDCRNTWRLPDKDPEYCKKVGRNLKYRKIRIIVEPVDTGIDWVELKLPRTALAFNIYNDTGLIGFAGPKAIDSMGNDIRDPTSIIFDRLKLKYCSTYTFEVLSSDFNKVNVSVFVSDDGYIDLTESLTKKDLHSFEVDSSEFQWSKPFNTTIFIFKPQCTVNCTLGGGCQIPKLERIPEYRVGILDLLGIGSECWDRLNLQGKNKFEIFASPEDPVFFWVLFEKGTSSPSMEDYEKLKKTGINMELHQFLYVPDSSFRVKNQTKLEEGTQPLYLTKSNYTIKPHIIYSENIDITELVIPIKGKVNYGYFDVIGSRGEVKERPPTSPKSELLPITLPFMKKEPTSVCGNLVCEEGENSDNCCLDCKCPAGKECVSGICIKKPKLNIIFVPINWKKTSGLLEDITNFVFGVSWKSKSFDKSIDEQTGLFLKTTGLMDCKDQVESKIYYEGCTINNFSCSCADLNKIAECVAKAMPENSGNVRIVGFTNRDLGEFHKNCNNTVGFTCPSSFVIMEKATVISETRYSETMTHELGHTFGLCDEYDYTAWEKQNVPRWDTQKKMWIKCPNQFPSECSNASTVTCFGETCGPNCRCIMGPAFDGNTIREFGPNCKKWMEEKLNCG